MPTTAAPEQPTAAQLASMYSIGEPDPVHDVASDAAPAPAPKPATTAPVTAAAPAAVTPAAAPPAAPAAKPAHTHPAWLAQQVADLGLSEHVLKLPTDDLGALVADANRRVREEARSQSRAEHVQGDRRPAEAAAPAAPEQEPAFDWGEVDDEDAAGRPVRRKATDADLHPVLVAVLKRQAKQIADLTAVIQQGQQTARAVQEKTFEQQLDASFSKFPDVFGVGDGQALKGTPQFARRRAAYVAMNSIPPDERGSLTVEQAVARVAAELFGASPGAQQAAAPNPGASQNASQNAAWNAAGVAVPTRRSPANKGPGRERAVEAVSELLDQNRADPADLASDATLDEFPG